MLHSTLVLAVTNDLVWMPWAGSALVGVAVLCAAWWLFSALATEDLEQGNEWRFDVNRINELRRVDPFYRLFQPIINFFARINRAMFRDALPRIAHDINAAGISRFWLPEEYLGRAELIALMLSPLFMFVAMQYFGMPGILMVLGAVILTSWWLRRRLAGAARKRLVMIKRRMPFLLDLVTLLMEAGSNFMQSLEQGVKEFQGHPVAVEFGRVLTDMSLGKTRTEAFRAMQQRLNDDEITSIIGSIIQGENLGSPMAQVFRTQSDVLRLKRTQRAETIAAEAGVNMLLPGILIMAATVLIILGPFALQFATSGLLF